MKLSAHMCRGFNAPAPLLPMGGTERFCLCCPQVAHHIRVLLWGTDWRETFCSALALYLKGWRGGFFLHYPLSLLRNQYHLLKIQKLVINKGLALRWTGQPHFFLMFPVSQLETLKEQRLFFPRSHWLEPWWIFDLSLSPLWQII